MNATDRTPLDARPMCGHGVAGGEPVGSARLAQLLAQADAVIVY